MKENYVYRQAKVEGRVGLSNQGEFKLIRRFQQANRRTSRQGGQRGGWPVDF